MGGRLAMHALVRPGAPWSKAVIISADPGHGHDPDRAKGDASWANLARSDWPEFCDQWSAEALFAEDDVDWDRSEYSAERQEAVAKGFEVWSVGKQRDLRSELKDVEIPILWIVGARDAKFVGLAESIVPILRDAQLLVVADAGHRVPWEQPEVVAEAIRSFLS
jgi:2-succinyl-6-hydroxy-2,4-cyclohexadiene-1-carboxylate synthase